MGAALPPVNLQYTSVPPATGNSLTDTANINAAIVAAGNGGIVSFPSNQVYVVRNYVGSTAVIPRLMLGNGSTLKLDAIVYTTIASGSISSGSVTVNVTNGAIFNIGDSIAVTDGASNFSYPTKITNINGNILTVVAFNPFASGSAIGVGAIVLRNDNCLYLQWPSATNNLALEVSGFTFDGNVANRIITGANSGQQWTNQQLVDLQGATGYTSAVWFHHNVFQNAPCDAWAVNDLTYVKVQDNLFQNIMGNGTHPGGSGGTQDIIVEGNTFFNVSQFTSSTTPTASNYGHIIGYGAMVTSVGPKRLVIANNVVDTAQGYGFDGLNLSLYHTDFSVTGNVFYNCTMGGFHCDGGKQATITGNIIDSCGHDTPYVTGNKENTSIGATNTSNISSKITVGKNIFIESPFLVYGDASEIAITGNSFTNLVNQYGTNYSFASLVIIPNSTGCSKIAVSGNEFRGPMNAAELTAVSAAPLNGIQMDTCTSVNISENVIVGYRHGIYTKNSMKNVKISGNILQDQIESSGTSAHGIYSTATVLQNYKILNNSISRLNDTTGNWVGIEQAVSPTTVNNASIIGNQISSAISPAATVGMQFNSFSMAGFKISDNEIWLNPGTGCWGITGASMTSACWAVNNLVHNGNLTNYGAATVTAGNQAF
jgi:parallel beta-helix repeat protein